MFYLCSHQMLEDDYEDEDMYASHPLKLMIRHQRPELLSHPLCRALVRYKWTKVRRYYIIILHTTSDMVSSLGKSCSTSTWCTTVSLLASSPTSWSLLSGPTTHWSWPVRLSCRIITPSKEIRDRDGDSPHISEYLA